MHLLIANSASEIGRVKEPHGKLYVEPEFTLTEVHHGMITKVEGSIQLSSKR
jgi:hypothetical protein